MVPIQNTLSLQPESSRWECDKDAYVCHAGINEIDRKNALLQTSLLLLGASLVRRVRIVLSCDGEWCSAFLCLLRHAGALSEGKVFDWVAVDAKTKQMGRYRRVYEDLCWESIDSRVEVEGSTWRSKAHFQSTFKSLTEMLPMRHLEMLLESGGDAGYGTDDHLLFHHMHAKAINCLESVSGGLSDRDYFDGFFPRLRTLSNVTGNFGSTKVLTNVPRLIQSWQTAGTRFHLEVTLSMSLDQLSTDPIYKKFIAALATGKKSVRMRADEFEMVHTVRRGEGKQGKRLQCTVKGIFRGVSIECRVME